MLPRNLRSSIGIHVPRGISSHTPKPDPSDTQLHSSRSKATKLIFSDTVRILLLQFYVCLFLWVQFSHGWLQHHRLQHARLSCPASTPEACSNSCPLSPWCHPTISSSVICYSSCSQSIPASGSFPMSQLAKVLEFQLQHQSFQWIFRTDLL